MNPDTIRDAEIVSVPPSDTPEPRKSYRNISAFFLGILVSVVGYHAYTLVTTPVAAVVNGTRITMSELDNDIAMMKQSAALQGIDVTDPLVEDEIKKQALDNLIANELLMSAVRKAGITMDDEDRIEKAYDDLRTSVGGEEELQARMTEIGLTEKELRANIIDRLKVDRYLEEVTGITSLTVSPEEVDAYIANLTDMGMVLPGSPDDLRPQIESSLLAEKQQQHVLEHIEKLRSEARIDIKLSEAATVLPPTGTTTEVTIDGK